MLPSSAQSATPAATLASTCDRLRPPPADAARSFQVVPSHHCPNGGTWEVSNQMVPGAGFGGEVACA